MLVLKTSGPWVMGLGRKDGGMDGLKKGRIGEGGFCFVSSLLSVLSSCFFFSIHIPTDVRMG